MPIDPVEFHKAAIVELSAARDSGELTDEDFRAESTPHARVIAALGRDQRSEGVAALVRAALARPALVEAAAIGIAHYFGSVAKSEEAS